MGARSDRITADDFITPLELAAWRLAAHPAGRIGGVRIQFGARAGRTCLTECYQQVPLRVLPPFHLGAPPVALIYLLNPTAGLLDGDAQLVQLHVGAGARAVVVGQSATRIHPAVHGFCTQHFRIHVERDGLLVMLPGPAIPFAGCRYYQHVEVTLDEGGHFVWGDLWQAGRHSRGAASERFRFDWLIQNMTVRRTGRLIYRDRFVWRGTWDATQVAWHFGPHLAWANLFATNVEESFLPANHRAGKDDCITNTGAWFPTAFGDTCVRWLGEPEALTGQLVAAALAAADRRPENPDGLGGLFSSGELAPNHWFHAGAEHY